MQLEIRRNPFKYARAVKHHRTEPGAVRARSHDGNIALVPVAGEKRPGLREGRRSPECRTHGGEAACHVADVHCSTPDADLRLQFCRRRAACTVTGQSARSIPWVAKSATASRSIPNATQAVCDISPDVLLKSQTSPK